MKESFVDQLGRKKSISTAKVLTLLKSNSTSISISNCDVAHETLPTSRFEIEMEVEFDFKKNEMSTEWINLSTFVKTLLCTFVPFVFPKKKSNT